MILATTWDGDNRGWSVLGQVRDRWERLLNARTQARRRIQKQNDAKQKNGTFIYSITAAAHLEQLQIVTAANWTGGWTYCRCCGWVMAA